MIAAPDSVEQLVVRARALDGLSLKEIAAHLGQIDVASGLHAKGKWGELLERALGATGGSRQVVDFPDLGVELKTLPIGENGRPSESTYVCRFRLEEAESSTWETSWVRTKLQTVLFIPIATQLPLPRVTGPFLWRPSEDEQDLLKSDFEELVGLVGAGRIEELSAYRGAVLQVRPKAQDGTKRKSILAVDGDYVATVPRGFYLRASFTHDLMLRSRQPETPPLRTHSRP